MPILSVKRIIEMPPQLMTSQALFQTFGPCSPEPLVFPRTPLSVHSFPSLLHCQSVSRFCLKVETCQCSWTKVFCRSGRIIRLSSLKSTSVSVCFRGISRLPPAFVFLRWFKLAHISIQVCTFQDGCKQGIDQQIFNRKSISRKITHPQSWKLQAKLAGEKLKGWSNSREKQTQDYN